ncbi:hypothetical protein WL93_26675 [Burkholderia diffusa]|uniref:hypothetical protein n=1 Tax=Burkholderia diffusa TaxID=488732 RepID=UPI00075745CF|nr:hypothetical protein [Burkholderia diffusa]KWF77599.1 hypothetical protein WL93_26675 [Burkholderia diffusa]
MATVLKFPKPPKRELPKVDVERVKAAMPRRDTIKGVLAFVWMLVRLPLFLVMYWLRMPVVLLCSVIYFPLLLAFGFVWYAFPEKTHMLWGFGVTSFAAFVIMWVYDFVLMALSPQEMMRTL